VLSFSCLLTAFPDLSRISTQCSNQQPILLSCTRSTVLSNAPVVALAGSVLHQIVLLSSKGESFLGWRLRAWLVFLPTSLTN
jgi:hypothetical protein